MPMAIIRVVEGVLDEAGKREVVERVTDALLETEGRGNEAFRPYIWVILEEVASGHWGVGGRGLTPEDVQALVTAGTGA
jgi:4-oxalocrotonate tautomerase